MWPRYVSTYLVEEDGALGLVGNDELCESALVRDGIVAQTRTRIPTTVSCTLYNPPTTGAPRWAACTSSQTNRCSTRLQATNRCRLRCAKGPANISRRGARTSRTAKPPPSNAKALALPPHFPPLWPSKRGICFQLLSELRDESVASFVHKQAHQSMQHRRRIQQRRRLTCKLTKKSKHFSSLEIELCSVCQFTNGFSSPGQKGPPKSRPRPVTFDGPCRGRQRERGRARIGSACPTTTQPVLPNRIVDIPVTLLGAWLVLV